MLKTVGSCPECGGFVYVPEPYRGSGDPPRIHYCQIDAPPSSAHTKQRPMQELTAGDDE